jgi:MFS superfamily sulfate permease-like transporter
MGRRRFSLTGAVPIVAQLRGYSRLSLRGDVVAAFAVATALVPQGLAYGQLAGLAPAAGLYTAPGAALVFSLVTSTRFVVVGVLVGAVVASAAFDLTHRGVAVVGAVAGGLPSLGIPAVTGAEVLALAPSATGIALIAIVETVAAIRKTTGADAVRIPLGREAAALGAASVASGVLGGSTPMGNASKSLSARGAGAHTQAFQIGSVLSSCSSWSAGGRSSRCCRWRRSPPPSSWSLCPG